MDKLIRILKNPFQWCSDLQLSISGGISFIAGILLAYIFNIQLQILRINPLAELNILKISIGHLIIVAAITLAYFALGRTINAKTRFIDILNTALVALSPVYLLFLQNANNFLYDETSKLLDALEKGNAVAQPSPIMILTSIISLLIIIYFVYLLFIGFKTATNAKKAWHYIMFFVLLFVIDAACSFLINSI